jgi:hypothetical protein
MAGEPDLLRQHHGQEVGEVARRMRPNGRLIDPNQDAASAIKETKDLMASASGPLFEACFSHDGLTVRADVIETGWLIEVKSSTSVKKDPPQHLEDVAVQAWVMEAAGYKLDGIAIEHVDNGFVLQEPGDWLRLTSRPCRSVTIASIPITARSYPYVGRSHRSIRSRICLRVAGSLRPLGLKGLRISAKCPLSGWLKTNTSEFTRPS